SEGCVDRSTMLSSPPRQLECGARTLTCLAKRGQALHGLCLRVPPNTDRARPNKLGDAAGPLTPAASCPDARDRRPAPRPAPHRPELAHPRLEAPDLQAQCSTARKGQQACAARQVSLDELDRQEVQHRLLAGRLDIAALAAVNPIEPQRRAAAPIIAGLRPLP